MATLIEKFRLYFPSDVSGTYFLSIVSARYSGRMWQILFSQRGGLVGWFLILWRTFGAIQIDLRPAFSLAAVGPDNDCGHDERYQGDTDQLGEVSRDACLQAGDGDCEQSECQGQPVEQVADLSHAKACSHQAMVQVRFIVVKRRLMAAHAVDNHQRYIQNGHTQHHQGQSQLRATHDRKYGQRQS